MNITLFSRETDQTTGISKFFPKKAVNESMSDCWSMYGGSLVYGKTDSTITTINPDLFSGLEKIVHFYKTFAYYQNLTKVNYDFDNAVFSNHTFSECPKLQSFEGNMPKLVQGFRMFYNCSSLTHVQCDLPNLSQGVDMFGSNNINTAPRLDEASVKYIVDNIKDWSGDSKIHKISIGTSLSNVTTYNTMFSDKGWSVTWQQNTATADLDNPIELFLRKYKTSLDCVEENSIIYTDGTNYYEIDWATKVPDFEKDEWTKFNTFDEGLNTWNLTKVN